MTNIVQSAFISAKGQLTMPKTIRDILGIAGESSVVFEVGDNNLVSVKKEAESDAEKEWQFNLMSFLFGQGVSVILRGKPNSGKRDILFQWLSSHMVGKKVVYIGDKSELASLGQRASIAEDYVSGVRSVPMSSSVKFLDDIVKGKTLLQLLSYDELDEYHHILKDEEEKIVIFGDVGGEDILHPARTATLWNKRVIVLTNDYKHDDRFTALGKTCFVDIERNGLTYINSMVIQEENGDKRSVYKK